MDVNVREKRQPVSMYTRVYFIDTITLEVKASSVVKVNDVVERLTFSKQPL